ncbi:MyD116-like domain protein [Fowlpox virus]|nr:MyD116-like domain protein [Fowlpox virus]
MSEGYQLPEKNPEKDNYDDDEWDESDEDSFQNSENIKLWNSFFNTDDPYNLLIFSTSFKQDNSNKKNDSSDDNNSSKVRKTVVTFSETVVEYYIPFEDRKGPWEEVARDRCRFRKRIKDTETVIGPCLLESHRQRISKLLIQYSHD